MSATAKIARARQNASDVVTWAHETLGLTFEELSAVLGADARTIRRWRNQQVSPQPRYRRGLEQLAEMRVLLGEVFDREVDMAAWFHTPMKGFRGKTPAAVIDRGGITEVIGVLATIESGAFM